MARWVSSAFRRDWECPAWRWHGTGPAWHWPGMALCQVRDWECPVENALATFGLDPLSACTRVHARARAHAREHRWFHLDAQPKLTIVEPQHRQQESHLHWHSPRAQPSTSTQRQCGRTCSYSAQLNPPKSAPLCSRGTAMIDRSAPLALLCFLRAYVLQRWFRSAQHSRSGLRRQTSSSASTETFAGSAPAPPPPPPPPSSTHTRTHTMKITAIAQRNVQRQHGTSNMLRTTCCIQCAAYNMLHTACCVQHAAYSVLRTTCSAQQHST
jgi:hypothetical protein